jgi:hypothetical protein
MLPLIQIDHTPDLTISHAHISALSGDGVNRGLLGMSKVAVKIPFDAGFRK